VSEPTITVTIPLDVARSTAAGRTEGYEAMQEIIAAALPPEWAEGTLARVHYGTADDGRPAFVTFAEWRGGEWKHANGLGSHELRHFVTKVEPIRTLPADRIAVPRPPDDWDVPSLRHEARNQRDRHNRNLAGWLESVADALEADPA
jgi:hypothetical protein